MPESPVPQPVGYLVVAATTARGSLPIEGAYVTVSAPVDGQPALYRAARTDSSGRTPVFELPAPATAESLTPQQPAPYASYTVTVDHEAYQPVRDLGVSIFPGIVATLPVRMTPRTSAQPRTRITDFPPEVLGEKGGR